MAAAGTNELDKAIAGVYLGPLESFVQRRDALVKELRAAGNREAAATVKALRKPSRSAWVLNAVAVQGDNVARLDAAIAATLEAQTSGGDVRSAMARLQQSVREFADSAVQAGQRAGVALEHGALMSAVLAVVGSGESLEALRRGRLAELPEAGGLDFLSALPDTLPVPERPRARPGDAPSREGAPAAPRTADVVDAARATLRAAESRLAVAEAQLRNAEAEMKTARQEYDRAQREAEAAAAEVSRAEQAAVESGSRPGE